MVLDNAHYQEMPKLSPVVLAGKLGIQTYIGVVVFGAIGLYAFSSIRNNYPYVFFKTRKEYRAQPDYFSQSVIVYDRQVENKMENL